MRALVLLFTIIALGVEGGMFSASFLGSGKTLAGILVLIATAVLGVLGVIALAQLPEKPPEPEEEPQPTRRVGIVSRPGSTTIVTNSRFGKDLDVAIEVHGGASVTVHDSRIDID